ncbi:hypothetical protein LXL04_006774 [Taraxacum kok-saghyz]
MERELYKVGPMSWAERTKTQIGTLDVYEKKFEFSSNHGVALLQMKYDEMAEFIWNKIKENKHQLRLVMKGGGGGGGRFTSRMVSLIGTIYQVMNLNNHLEKYTNLAPKREERAISGKTKDSNLTFKVDGKVAFDLPVDDMSGTSVSKKQVSINFPLYPSISELRDELVGITFEMAPGRGSIGRAEVCSTFRCFWNHFIKCFHYLIVANIRNYMLS